MVAVCRIVDSGTDPCNLSRMSNSVPVVLADLVPTPRILDNRWVRDITLVAGGALFTALAAQFVIHLGFTPVPITGQTFAVLTVGSVLGSRRAAASQAVYWLLGMIGLPFYASGTSGWTIATGPNFGYFIGFIVAAGLIGYIADRRGDRNYVNSFAAMTLGTVVIYIFGALWLAHSANWPLYAKDPDVKNAISMGVSPFLVGDFLKMLLAAAVAPLGWAAFNIKQSHDND